MRYKRATWVSGTNVYEVNTRQYTEEGNFRAFMEHIPRLKDMGVHTLWFMPVTPISVLKRKGSLGSYYACSDYTSINPEFGTMEDFKALVVLAHQEGMKVIIDWVANHTGADHIWTTEHPGFYIRNEAGECYDKHGWDDVIDLDYGNPALREAMIDCMRFWIEETGIDGFRCDMAMLVPVDFWHQARTALDDKELFWLAECDQWNDPAYLEVFDAAYSWKWMHVTEDYYKHGPNVYGLKDTLMAYAHMHPGYAIKAWFTSNHDENSWNGTEFEKYGDMAIPLAVFSCTWDGIPLLYSGQEIPNRKRLAFFEKDALDWNGGSQMHDFFRTLLQLRASHPALVGPADQVETGFLPTDHADKVIAFRRRRGQSELLALVNLSPYPLDVHIYDPQVTAGMYIDIFRDSNLASGQGPHIHLAAWGYILLSR